MEKIKCLIELQTNLLELARVVVKMNVINDKYEAQKTIFSPFNNEFIEICKQIPDSFYLKDKDDKEILDNIIELTDRIKHKIKAIENKNE